jgi:hypothetical protein
MKKYLNNLFTGAYAKTILSIGLLVAAGWTWNARAQETKPRIKLGAYYFAGWAGKSRFDDGTPENAWAKGAPMIFTKKLATEFAGRKPIWGWRDDTPELVERQIDLAADHGLAYFSYCWYWAENKGPIDINKIESNPLHMAMSLFMNAKNNNRMEFCLLVANHQGYEIIGADAWKSAADYWIKNYFKHPRYLRLDGKPLVIIFSPRGGNAEGFAYMQEAARKAGLPGVAIACSGDAKPEDGYSLRTRYNVIPGYGKPDEMHPYSELVEAHVREWRGSPEQRCIPEATVGWDARARGTKSWYYEGKTPEDFREFLNRMVKWMDENPDQVTKDRLATICAWNELDEGSWLVPCKDDPDGAYLKVIRSIVLGK